MKTAFLAILVAVTGCAARPIWHEPTLYRVWTFDRLSGCPESPDDAPMPTTAAVAISPQYAVAPLGGAGWLAGDFTGDARVTLFDGEWRFGEIVEIDLREGFVLIRLDEPASLVPLAPGETATYRSIPLDWEDGRLSFQFDEGGRLIRIVSDDFSVLDGESIPEFVDGYFASWGRRIEPKPVWK